MLHHMFIFGVVIPTIITISVFIGFLICWFKFNMADRFFKKPLDKNHHKHGIVHETSSLSQEETQQDDSTFSPNSNNDGNNENGGSGPGNNTINMIKCNQALPKNGQMTHEVDMREEVETAMCVAENIHNNSKEGYVNPNLCLSPTDLKAVDVFTQHTFHFVAPDITQLNGPGVESDDDDEGSDDNYSHFVPLSQALKDPKTRQFFEKSGEHLSTNSKYPDNCTASLLPHTTSQLIEGM